MKQARYLVHTRVLSYGHTVAELFFCFALFTYKFTCFDAKIIDSSYTHVFDFLFDCNENERFPLSLVMPRFQLLKIFRLKRMRSMNSLDRVQFFLRIV